MTNWSSSRVATVGVVAAVVAVGALWWVFRDDSSEPSHPHAQPASEYRVAVFSYVTHPVLDQVRAATEAGLNEFALRDGARITFANFNAEGSDTQIALLSQTILQGNYDLVIPIATPVSRQIIVDAPTDRPIVYSFVTNPENLGAERFDKNVTGVSDAVNYAENVRALLAWMPSAKTIGFLHNPAEPNSVDALNRTRPLVEGAGATLVVATVNGGPDVSTVAASIAPQVDVFYVGGDNTVVGEVPSLVAVAKQYGRPVFASDSGSVSAGAVAAISVDYDEIGRETAQVAWRVLHEKKQPRAIPPVSVPGTQALYNAAAAASFDLTPPPGEFSFEALEPEPK